ncbi:MAG: LapA family protein [Paracoccaceae bacterium]|jgi:uncharacterized integral membrane protein|nr:LapA family protein [Paracoccaceae bacterium]
MIRFFKYAFLFVLTAVLLAVALANRQLVTLKLLTPELETFSGWSWSLDVPLYFVAFGGVAIGLLIGFIWEWIRESKHRQEVAKRQNQVRSLKREVTKLKGEKGEQTDDVLALIDNKPRKAG